MSFLKDAFSFACKPNQSLNQLRRTLIRPSGQTRQFSNLADIKNEIFEYFFADSISYILETLNRKNKVKYLLKRKQQS